MKPIKLKELLRTAKDPATQRIVIDEGLWFDAPLFEGVVKDVDEALGERIISNWQVETDGTRLIVSSNPPLQDLQECRPSKIAHKAYEKSNKEEWEEYYQFEQYKRWTVKKWRVVEGKMVFYIAPTKQKSRPTFSDEPARKLSTEETQ